MNNTTRNFEYNGKDYKIKRVDKGMSVDYVIYENNKQCSVLNMSSDFESDAMMSGFDILERLITAIKGYIDTKDS